MKKSEVIVIGGIHHNTLGVIRSLSIAGIKDIFLILVGVDSDFVSCSKYIKKKNLIKLKSDEQLLDILLKIGPTFSSKPTIICSSDTSISIVDQNLKDLSRFFLLPNAFKKQDEINRLMDKSIQCAIAEQCGFNIPQSKVITNLQDLEMWNIFPCIIKPIESICGSKSDIKVYQNKHDLYEDVLKLDVINFQIQQFIEKDIEFQLIGCSINHGKKLFIPGYTNIIRQPPNTNTGFLYYKQLDEIYSFPLKNSVHLFMETIGYEGLFSLEFLRDKKGNVFFLEINMRNDGNSFCVTAAGVNLPYLFFLYKNGLPLEKNTVIKQSVYFMPELEDFILAMKSGTSIFSWINDFWKTKAHAVFSLGDPLPFICKFSHFGLNFFTKRLRKIFRK